MTYHYITSEYINNEIEKIKTYYLGADDIAREIYDSATEKQRSDLLIPKDAGVLYDEKVKSFDNGLGWNYCWNENNKEYSEFITERCFCEDGKVNEGQIVDRLGGEHGFYVCPVILNKWVYGRKYRSLPYYFKAEKTEEEPSYHKYRVLREISGNELRKDRDIQKFEKKPIKNVIMGIVAPVEAFREQGEGGAFQIRFPVDIFFLKLFGYIEEINPNSDMGFHSASNNSIPDELLFSVRTDSIKNNYYVKTLNNRNSIIDIKEYHQKKDAEQYAELQRQQINEYIYKILMLSKLIKREHFHDDMIVDLLKMNEDIEQIRIENVGRNLNFVAKEISDLENYTNEVTRKLSSLLDEIEENISICDQKENLSSGGKSAIKRLLAVLIEHIDKIRKNEVDR